MSTNLSESVPRLKRLVPRMRGKRIAVVGDLMLDRYLWGTASRLSPEAAVPVVDFVEQTDCLGGAGNVAANLAALGARVEMFGVVGGAPSNSSKDVADDPGAVARHLLRAANIIDKGVFADPKRITTVKTRIIARHQHIVRVDRERREPLRSANRRARPARSLRCTQAPRRLVLSDYDKGLITDEFADRVLSACHRLKVPVFVGPKRSRLYAYRGAKAIVCNAKEASQFVSQSLTDEKSVEEVGRALLGAFRCGPC